MLPCFMRLEEGNADPNGCQFVVVSIVVGCTAYWNMVVGTGH